MTFTNLASAPVGERPLEAAEAARPPVLDVVIPVFNEETDLGPCVRRLHAHLTSGQPYPFRITVADNASTDRTLALATELAAEYPGLRVVHLPEKGKGRALRRVWSTSDADVLAYMDVDLSTDLAALLPLIAPLVSGHSDIAIGTRLHRGARVVRGAKREFVSRGYNLVLRRTLSARFSDGGCGFKAIRRDVAQHLLPLVADDGWFFDTELLVIGERAGLRIHEVPVDWIDDPDSSVRIASTAMADLRGIARLGRALATGALPLHDVRAQLGRGPLVAPPDVPIGLFRQLVRFGAVGVFSTVAYLAIFLGSRGPLGSFTANFLALLLTTVANTALNRRFTFGWVGARHVARHHIQGLLVFGLALGLTSGALYLAHAAYTDPPTTVEVAMLVAANGTATVMRFLLLRRWVFRRA